MHCATEQPAPIFSLPVINTSETEGVSKVSLYIGTRHEVYIGVEGCSVIFIY